MAHIHMAEKAGSETKCFVEHYEAKISDPEVGEGSKKVCQN